MPNPKIKQITLPSGTTYDIADSRHNVWYGTCSTGSDNGTKIVTTATNDFTFNVGNIVFVVFTYPHPNRNVSLQVDNTQAIAVTYDSSFNGSVWDSHSIVGFIFTGGAFKPIDSYIASTTVYGKTKLANSVSSDTTTAVTPKAVQDYVGAQISGAAAFQGAVTTANPDMVSDDPTLIDSNYIGGYYWVVTTAGLYPVGENLSEYCEVGDFIFCINSKNQVYDPADFAVLQSNIDMNRFGDLAQADTASATYTPAGSITQPTFSGTQATITTKTSGAVTGISANTTASGGIDITTIGTISSNTPISSATTNYTPEGTVSQPTFSGTSGNISVTTNSAVTAVSGNVNTTSSGGIDIKPAGSVSTPTITVTPATGTVNSITAVGTLPSFTATVANENLTFAWDAGTLPTQGENTTVVTGITSASSTQPTFTGTQKYLHIQSTKDTVTSTGNFTPNGTVSQPTFSGTGTSLEFTATKKYLHTTKSEISATGTYTPAGTVSQPTFTGTQTTITVEPDDRS